MALLPASTDYSDKDFDALKARTRNLITAVFPDWTDDNVADFGNILTELFCFVGDVLTKVQDNQARETRWTTATQRKNLLALAKLVGFNPVGATAATAVELFTLSAPAAAKVVLPAGTFVRTEEITAPIRYQLTADLTLEAGVTSASATVENSAFASDVFTSTGLANQSFALTQTPYIDATAQPVAGDGPYVQVDNFLKSLPTDRHFTVVVDQSDRAKITFGNGVNGSIPSGNITSPYRIGGGAAGRVEQNRLVRLEGNFADIHGNSVTFAVTNPVKSSGGNDRATNGQIRQLAPESVRVSDRCGAREDFEIVARKVPGVSRALMLTADEVAGLPENSGILFIVPPGAGTPSQGLLDAVFAKFALFPYPNTFDLTVQAAAYLTADIVTTVYFPPGTTLPAKVAGKALILANLATFFADQLEDGTSNPSIDFGFGFQVSDGTASLSWSDVFNVVRDTKGVKKLHAGALANTINGARADLTLALQQFPKLGTVTVVDGDTGVAL